MKSITSKPKETDIQKDILIYLNSIGATCWRVNTVGIYDPITGRMRRAMSRKWETTGISDILAFYKGTMYAIEVKTPKRIKQVSVKQKLFLDCVNSCGCVGVVVSSLDEVLEVIK